MDPFAAALQLLEQQDRTWRPRPEQTPPDGDWLVWAFIAGRGAGKTRSAAEWVCDQARTPGLRIALVGRTPADVRDVMVEGESGILACSPASFRPEYQPTRTRLVWPNGTIASTYSAEVPAALRGPQHHVAWADEVSSWTDAPKGDIVDTAWSNLKLGLRLPGHPTRVVVTTTPKPNRLTRDILGRPNTVVTRSTTYANLANLSPEFRDEVVAAYEGTRLGRQELYGELLDDVVGALFTPAMIEAGRVKDAPELARIVVGVDPSGGGSDECGIVVAGVTAEGQLYVLEDVSAVMSPDGWARAAVDAYDRWSADRIVAEQNYGGAMVQATLHHVRSSVPVRMVSASRGKRLRAEPVAALYEQHKVHHVGVHARLEDQMCSWTPGSGSPDRLDALVWAVTELSGGVGALGWLRAVSRACECGMPVHRSQTVCGSCGRHVAA